ncbi:hypothetical protein [Amnibacterium sp.]|uniref:hypothetical protein n=1 Tax=Amnibacterium sp. TaxID=1872496 RepID=UPI002609B9CF|nr:hypothetical protein [Amnibacterium sp.]
MTNGLSTLPVPRQAPRPTAPSAAHPPRTRVRGPSLARRRWGFALAVVLMLATLPLHLLGLALVALEVLSPSTDGSGPLFVGGVGLGQLLLLVAVAAVGQLVGGGGAVWRRRFALACLNALLVVIAAAIGWAFLL